MTLFKRLRRSLDPGFFVVLLISLLAVWPLISRASLPEGTDAELHIFRLHELSYLIRGGEYYPRWAPDFYHGYGYPIFNYYAPLSYYLALPFELLPGIDAVLASKAVLVAGMLLAGIGTYGYVRDNWGRHAGYIAAALYVYSPYVHYIDPHVRGALPEALSFGTFPLALWALDRLRRRRAAGPWLASVPLVAAVILSHNLMGPYFYGVLAAWVVWQAFAVRNANGSSVPGWAAFGRLAAAMAVGLGLAAFFWLPVLLERNAVTLNTLIGAGSNYDFRTHFLEIGELAAFSQRPDWGATQSPFLFNLGVAQWMGGLIGLFILLTNRVRERVQLAFFALAAMGTLFLMLPVSEPVWELLPFLPYFQFPWRLLGAMAAMLAVLGGAGTQALIAHASRSKTARVRPAWLTAAAVSVPMVLALPLSQPATWSPFGEVNTLRMSLIENSGRWLGTTSTADYVPATVIMLPERRSSVVDPLADGRPPDRVNHEAMPDGASVTTEQVRPLLTRYKVVTPKQFRLRLYQFDFPGWQVRVDGEPARTELAEPEGFIVVLVPEGEHVVEVEFGETPARVAAWLITLASLVMALYGGWRMRDRRADSYRAPQTVPSIRHDTPILVAAGGLTLGVLLLQPLGLFHAQSSGHVLDIAANELDVNLDDQIALLGYNASDETVSPGDDLFLTLYWKARRPLDIDYQVFVHVLDEQGNAVAQSDKLNPGEFPTRRWPTDKYVPDRHRLAIPEDLPPGNYTVAAGLWVQSEGWRLPVLDGNGQQIGDRVSLFTLKVE